MMRGFRAAFIGLFVWAALAWPQRPSESDAEAAIERSRQKGLDYARSLPDFVCTEVIHRYADTRRRGRWILTDKLTIKLSYFQQKEEHKLTLIDNKPTNQTFESLDGAIGVGEFGGTLKSIFDPASEAVFRWESWKNVRKHRAAVYAYVVEASHSSYILMAGSAGNIRQAIVGYHGLLDIDSETGAVLHFTYEADRIPKALGMDYALTTVDYAFAGVAGREYLLPAHSETEIRSQGLAVRNQMEFSEYRKFATESTITFGPGK